MKVLLVVSSYAPNAGGLQTVTRQLANELRARGDEVEVIANRYPRTLSASEILDGVRVTRWHFLAPRLSFLSNLRWDLFLAGFLYFPLTLLRLALFLRRERPDVVNVHFVGAPALFVSLARWLVPFRFVVSVHGDDVEGLATRGRLDRRIFRSLLRQADVVTACSRYLLERAINIAPAAAGKGVVINNGLDSLSDVKPGPPTGTVVAAGRMVPSKGFDVLLQAQAYSNNGWKLILIGDGPENDRLVQLAGSLGLNGRVKFCSDQPRTFVLEAMAAADLVVVPSRQDSFGMVALEAMALGKVVVASRIGGLPEILEGADALLVEAGDADQLAAAIDLARERSHREPQYGLRNRELAARFSTHRMANGYLDAYRHD